VGDSKTLPPEMTARVVACVEALIAKYPGKSLRQIAPLVGFEQPQLSAMRKGRGIGILTLIRLRAATRMPIDDLLGLEPLETERERRIARIVANALAAEDEPASPDSSGPIHPKKGTSDAPRPHRR
jgi:hypothetical protein